jgi:hypothetical protein
LVTSSRHTRSGRGSDREPAGSLDWLATTVTSSIEMVGVFDVGGK